MYGIMKQRKRECLQLALIIVVGQVFLVVSATINANALNELIAMNWQAFLFQEILLMLTWGILIFFDWLSRNYKMYVIQELDIVIRDEISKDISNMSYQEFHKKSVGTYVSWLNNDIQTINKQGFEMFFLVVKGLSGTCFAVITLIKYHWSLAVVTLLSLIIMLSIPKIFGKKMRRASLNTTLQNEEFLKEAENTLNGFDVFASLNILRIIPKKIKMASHELKNITLKQTKIEALVNLVGFSWNIFFQILLTIFTGYLAFMGVVTIGTIEATGALAGIVFTTLGDLSTQLSAINGTKPIFSKFKTISQIPSIGTGKYVEETTYRYVFEATNLGYRYNQQEIFKRINFKFEKNGKYLICGHSGSGKTTLFKILNGFLRDYEGSIKFCGIEINCISDKDMLKHVLLIDQDTYLLTGTVRENILLDETFTDEEIRKVLSQVGLEKELAISNFLDIQVGENGRLLSGGQNQRVALARGLIRNKKIILIDEGTSAVDKKTSIDIEKNLLQQADLTVILITHSPHEELSSYFTNQFNFPENFY